MRPLHLPWSICTGHQADLVLPEFMLIMQKTSLLELMHAVICPAQALDNFSMLVFAPMWLCLTYESWESMGRHKFSCAWAVHHRNWLHLVLGYDMC